MIYAWTDSPDVPVLERPVRQPRAPSATETPENLQRLKSALDAIENTNPKLDYDTWWRVVAAIDDATEHSDEGYELAVAFSERAAEFDPVFFENRIWPSLRSEREGAVITAASVYMLARSHGWIDPEAPDPQSTEGFECTESATQAGAPATQAAAKTAASVAVPAPPTFKFERAAEFSRGAPPEWLVHEVIPKAEIGVIYGASGSGKSFFTLDLACSIATGAEWRGKRVEKGRVAIIVAEGAGGFRARLRAYCEHYKLDIESLDIFVLAGAPNFRDRKHIEAVVDAMRAAGKFSLVIVDTLAQVSAGANENSGEDMSVVLGYCKVIHQSTGALVLLIHHSGKDESKGSRGWSGIKGALDVEISILRAEENRVAKVSKMKDGEEGERFGFKLQSVPLGENEFGEPITSCVVEYTAVLTGGGRDDLRDGGRGRAMLQWIIDAVGPGNKPIKSKDAIDGFAEELPEPEIGRRDTRKQRAKNELENLVDKGYVSVLEGFITVLTEDE